jgi:hypothetical protein
MRKDYVRTENTLISGMILMISMLGAGEYIKVSVSDTGAVWIKRS